MRFWDTSALFASMASEPGSASLPSLLAEEATTAIWRLTTVEVRSALFRRVRGGTLDPAIGEELWERFLRMRREFFVVDRLDAVADRAESLVRKHFLRAADALQLAAATFAREVSEASIEFVTLDRRLAEAAAAEGFVVLPPPTGEGRVAERSRRPRRRGRHLAASGAGLL
ncbi:MAG: type II toxin-antitoxin system VapC family toxin [Planctomycetes bacterium]|nr:type II toxin-antitoxin system VapC family toxin [Planctomycetota bacterium]